MVPGSSMVFVAFGELATHSIRAGRFLRPLPCLHTLPRHVELVEQCHCHPPSLGQAQRTLSWVWPYSASPWDAVTLLVQGLLHLLTEGT